MSMFLILEEEQYIKVPHYSEKINSTNFRDLWKSLPISQGYYKSMTTIGRDLNSTVYRHDISK